MVTNAREFSATLNKFAEVQGSEATGAYLLRSVEMEGGEFVTWINRMVPRVADEILATTLSDDQKTRHLAVLQDVLERVNKAVFQSQGNQFISTIRLETCQAKVQALSDLVEAGGGRQIHELDRQAFVVTTQSLAQNIRESALPPYAKSAIQIKLSALEKMMNNTAIYPDDEVRFRVKAVVADFLAEFENFDKGHQDIKEQVIGWARPVLQSGVFLLALAADGSSVAGLITDQRSNTSLESPAQSVDEAKT